ncbi:MAG: methyltransferase domain-containing protein [Acidobacteria bacterium]|nr:methyltransferase domain-containing protein [Acidobacteriota bacterium]
MMTKELPKEAEIAKKKNPAPHLFISDWLNEFEAKRAKEFHRRTGLDYKTLLKHIIDTAALHPGMRVVELAAGTGMIARHLVGLVGREGHITGVDSTKDLIEQARLEAQSAKVGTRIEWRVAPLNHLPFPKGELDLVACGTGFNQLEATDLFSESYRILRQEGLLLIAAEVNSSNGPSFVNRIRQQYYRLLKRDHDEAKAHFYSTDELSEMLRAAGFRQIIIRGLKGDTAIAARDFSLIKAVK